MEPELSHEVGVAEIAAALSYGTDGKIGGLQELSGGDKAALDNVLAEGHTEGLAVDPVEVGAADTHICADLVNAPNSHGVVINSVTKSL